MANSIISRQIVTVTTSVTTVKTTTKDTETRHELFNSDVAEFQDSTEQNAKYLAKCARWNAEETIAVEDSED